MLTLCVFPITPPLPACIVYDCREGRGVIIGIHSVSISFLFLFFFHQSSLIQSKMFLFTSIGSTTVPRHCAARYP